MIFLTGKKFVETIKKNLVLSIALCVALLVFIGSAIALIIHFIPEKNSYEKYTKTGSVPKIVTPEKKDEKPDNPIDFAALKSQNQDVCGWITVDGTNINYPVLRSGADKAEDFYLNHDLAGAKKTAGSIYIQRLNSADFSDSNTVIYGHNMLNGSMFASLKNFRNTEFFNTNRNMYIYTPGHAKRYEIVAAFLYDDRHIINSFNFNMAEGMQAYIDTVKNPQTTVRNMLPGAELSLDDKLITLSTCTSKSKERYLVVGRLTEDTLTK